MYLTIHTVDVYHVCMNTITTTYKRINITLPETTIKLIDRVAKKGDRSGLIDSVLRKYVADVDKKELRKQLKAGAIAMRGVDLKIAEEWFPLEEEAWLKSGK